MIHGTCNGVSYDLLFRLLLQPQPSKPDYDDVVTNQVNLQDQEDDHQHQLRTTIKCLQDQDVLSLLETRTLPEDFVLIEIISRLPINRLINLSRFKPSWSSILFDFILRQLFRYDHDDANIDVGSSDEIFIRDESSEYICSLSFRTLAPLDDTFSEATPWSGYQYVGSVNGLLVFSADSFLSYQLFLWNPKTHSIGFIEPWDTCASIIANEFKFFMGADEQAFGSVFSAQSKDYKIVHIISMLYYPRLGLPRDDDTREVYTSWDGIRWDIFDEWFETERFFAANDTVLDMDHDDWDEGKFSAATNCSSDPGYRQAAYLVILYNSSTDSWRRVAIDEQIFAHFSSGACFFPQKGFTKDTFSWLVCIFPNSAIACEIKLLTFHMTREVFQLTSLPDTMLSGGYDAERFPYLFPIQFFNGTIGMVVPALDSSSFEIWILLEYGVMDSWIRLCTLGPFPDVRYIAGVWKNGKVFLVSTSGELLVADLVTNQIIQNLHIKVSHNSDIMLHLKT